jgi:hypothetical protein
MSNRGFLLACLSVPLFLSWMASPDIGDFGDRCPGVFSLQVSSVGEGDATLSWVASANTDSVALRWREVGQAWNEISNAESPFLIEGLTACSAYEAQVQSQCVDGPGEYSPPVFFEADGCCRIPSGFTAISVQREAFTVGWDTVGFAINFDLRFRPAGTPKWDTIEATGVETVISGLTACTAYDRLWHLHSGELLLYDGF